jgi:signal transduction histidine kinase/lipid-A-disaccharide synthase-like uncharacterized protein
LAGVVRAWRNAIGLESSIEAKLFLLALAGAMLFATLVAALFLVQHFLSTAQRQVVATTVPTQQALGGLETALAAAFERQMRVVAAQSAQELAGLRDHLATEKALSGAGTRVAQSLAANATQTTVGPLSEHSHQFLESEKALFLSAERRLDLRARFENRLTQTDADLRKLIEAANALSGVLQFERVIVLRDVARRLRSGTSSPALLRTGLGGDIRAQLYDVTDLVQAANSLGWLSGKTGLALTEDTLNSIAANEIAQNRVQSERYLMALSRRAKPGSEVAKRVEALAEQMHAILPTISDEARQDSLVWLRRHVLIEAEHEKTILAACATLGQAMTVDVALLSQWSKQQADETVNSSERATRWSRVISFLVSLLGLLVCVFSGIRIRDSVSALRVTNGELADLRDNLELKVSARTNELSASREQYRLLVETTKTIPFEMTIADLRFAYVGPQVQDVLGISTVECVAPGFLREHLHPDDQAKTLLALSATSSEDAEKLAQDMEFRLRRSGGGYTWVRLIASVVSVAGTTDAIAPPLRPAAEQPSGTLKASLGSVLRGVLLDVTLTHDLELQLRQAQKLESVGRLASGVAHEINTPIQFVNDNVQFLKTSFDDLVQVLARYRALRAACVEGTDCGALSDEITAAEEAADLSYVLENAPPAFDRSIEGLGRITSIVRSLKEFAHPDEKEMTSVDLNQALSCTLTIARNEYKYVADVATDFGDIPTVMCHPGEMNQAFLNIIVNASHAIADVVQGSDIRGRISVTSRRQGDDVILRISDTGGGIPEHILDRMFDPFFTTKAVGKGTGQGLAIARSVVVDKHGGDISVETELGKGTCFVLRLPISGAAA